MANLYVKELEAKIAHYEAIMIKCPQCKTNLPTTEAESSNTADSRQSRPSRPVQWSAVNKAPPVPTRPSDPPVSSAQRSKQTQPVSRTEPTASDSQRNPISIPPIASSNRSRRPTKASVANTRQPPTEPSDSPRTRSGKPSAADTSGKNAATSQVSVTRPGTTTLSQADIKKHYGGTVLSPDLQPYKSRNQGENWTRAADIMLEEVPSGSQWREKLKKIESSVIAAVAINGPPIVPRHVPRTAGRERNELIRRVRNYAERHSEVRLNFQHFVLVCLCNVLSYQGVSRSSIVETLQICISNTAQKNVERYLKGATWVNKMMNELFFTDWGYRAVDLIAIWNRSVAAYGALGYSANTRQYFLTELTQRKYFENYQEVPNRKHNTIPWIVKKELGDEVSYESICKALGYSHEYFERTRHLHSSSPSNPEVNDGENSNHEDSNHEDSNHEDSYHEDSNKEDPEEDSENEDSENEDSASRNSSFRTARQSTISNSSRRRPTSADESPSSPSTSASGPRDTSLLRRQLQQEGISNSTASGSLQGDQRVEYRRIQRMLMDRSTTPLGDSEDVGRRRPPYDEQGITELMISSSLGESAPRTQSTKRPLPASPSSAIQPNNTTRRRQHIGNESSGEE